MTAAPWLSLVGIGEDGRDGLSRPARAALDDARLVVGGVRHLALAAPLLSETMAWPSPITDALPAILARRGTPVAVLATGDPFHYGVGTMLSQQVAPSEIASFPQPSAFSLAASRLCWSLQDVALVSVHGRGDGMMQRQLAHGAKLLVLSWDSRTPLEIASLLRLRGYGRSRIVVLEAMGGARERIRETTADDFDLADVDPLNTVAIECATHAAETWPLTCLPDDAFENDGQITKQSIRAVTLAALAPRGGELLWDIGAGSGSISIEWLRVAASNRVVAIEDRPERVQRLMRNAARHGVAPQVVTGRAPEALAGLAAPDAIFVGGGVADARVTAAACAALAPAGRLVANAVTLESHAHLTRCHGAGGGELVQLQHAHASPVGRLTGWRAAMPVVQWRWRKPV